MGLQKKKARCGRGSGFKKLATIHFDLVLMQVDCNPNPAMM
jgi:hypothetical protein